MTVEEKLWKIVQALHKKTALGEITWEETLQKSAFQTSFPTYTIQIHETSSETAEDAMDYVVSLFNDHGGLVERASDVSIQKAVGVREVFPTMSELYTLARRSALGTEKALDDLLAQLS